MRQKLVLRYFDNCFVLALILIFFLYNLNRIDYGLPFFLNLDEIAFQYSTLSYLGFITGYFHIIDPIYAPFINLIFILKSIFVNEFLINSLNFDQIKSKIYFNTELFIYYGRVASLITSSFSIFFLYLIFKKLKINFFIYALLLLTLCTSLVILDVAIVNGKHSYYLLIFLVQLYFFFKYLIKIEKFNFKSYIFFSIFASLGWGVSYWPAFISIYAVLVLHLQKFRYSKIYYPLTFSVIFFIFGPILGMIISNAPILDFIMKPEELEALEIKSFSKQAIIDFFEGLKIIYYAEKNFFLVLFFSPLVLFLQKKNENLKKNFFIIFVIFFEPVILLAIAQQALPQLRYFIGNTCIILILTGIIFNEIYKSNLKYLCVIFLISNFYFIYNNLNLNNQINNIMSKKHSFYVFNNSINVDKKKILYLVDLNFQESLKQNKLYLELYENNLIKKSPKYEANLKRIKDKINKIKTLENKIILNHDVKENIIYFNYSFHEITDFEMFFNYIRKYFDYIVIEESKPFYLTNRAIHNEISKYVKKNFLIEQIYSEQNKIFLRSLRSVIHYHANAINVWDHAKNIDKKNFQIVYGSNYSLYKLN